MNWGPHITTTDPADAPDPRVEAIKTAADKPTTEQQFWKEVEGSNLSASIGDHDIKFLLIEIARLRRRVAELEKTEQESYEFPPLAD